MHTRWRFVLVPLPTSSIVRDTRRLLGDKELFACAPCVILVAIVFRHGHDVWLELAEFGRRVFCPGFGLSLPIGVGLDSADIHPIRVEWREIGCE